MASDSVTLEATIDDRGGNPVEGATVFFSNNGRYEANATTDATGKTGQVSVPPGFYEVHAVAPGYLEYTADSVTADANTSHTLSATMDVNPHRVRGHEQNSDSTTESTGVLGVNTATSGVPIGVRGDVLHPQGYGLYTRNDALVAGQLTVGSLNVTDQLPRYAQITKSSARETIDTLSMYFDETAWADGTYRDGPSHGQTSAAFRGSVVTQRGEVVFVPADSANIGVYDPRSDTYTSGVSHSSGSSAFAGGVLSTDGEVVFAPMDADSPLQYDPATDSIAFGPLHGAGANAFAGAALTHGGDVVFAPQDSDHVGIYSPSSGTYTQGPTHGEGNGAFWGAVLTPYGQVVLVPHNSDYVGVYDPESDSYIRGPAHSEGDAAFMGGALVPTGAVVFAPYQSSTIGLFDPSVNEYSYTGVLNHNAGDYAFIGASLSPTGNVVFAPQSANGIGVYDPQSNSFDTSSLHGQGSAAFAGVSLTPLGELVCAPFNASKIGSYDSNAQTRRPRATAMHPLVNNT